jgi:ferredoxin--NADP+ reductase
VFVPPAEAELDDLSLQSLDEKHDRGTGRKIEMLQAYTRRQATGKPRRLIIRFLVSPVELVGNAAGQVRAIRLVKNKLYATEAGTLRPQPTGEYEELPVGLVFRSVGYRGVPLPGVPFDERWGVLLNQKGRVFDPSTSQPLPGIYTAGWIKRGPTGVIGTNKPDALETVKCMLEDIQNGSTLHPISPDPMAVEKWLREYQPAYVSYADWLRLNALEVAQGKALGRPRLKYTSVEEMLTALQKDPTAIRR